MTLPYFPFTMLELTYNKAKIKLEKLSLELSCMIWKDKASQTFPCNRIGFISIKLSASVTTTSPGVQSAIKAPSLSTVTVNQTEDTGLLHPSGQLQNIPRVSPLSEYYCQ